jgi:hypothetical protein
MPDGHKIDQMAIKYTNIFHRNTKFTQIGIFGLKTNHLATQRATHIEASLFVLYDTNIPKGTTQNSCFV